MHFDIQHKTPLILGILIVTVTLGSWYGPRLWSQHTTEHTLHPSPQAAEFGTTPSPTPKDAATSTQMQVGLEKGQTDSRLCLKVPILMYHHVEDLSKAKQEGHAQFTIGTPFFRKDMEYLQNHGYHVIPFAQLI